MDLTWCELAAIAKALALLQERIPEPTCARHAEAVATLHDKLLAIAAREDLLKAKA